jgi:stage II sporulation protein D
MLRHFASLCLSALLCASLGGCSLRQLDPSVVDISTEPMIRVRIAYTVPEISVVPPAGTALMLLSDASNPVVPVGAGEWTFSVRDGLVQARSEDGQHTLLGERIRLEGAARTEPILVKQVPVGVGWWWENRQDRSYEGEMTFSAKEDGTLDVILALPTEEYLRGVVPAEIGETAPMEAQRAQAVAARSETMTALTERTYAGPGYDICADVNCQVFAGSSRYRDVTDAAIRDTRGMILTYDGKPLPAYYASNCGGYSEDVANVWPSRERGIPTWRAHPDGKGGEGRDLTDEATMREWIETRPEAYCNGDYHPNLPDWTKSGYRWEREETQENLSAMVAEKKDIGRVLRIEPLERSAGGRLIRVRFVGEKGTYETGPELAIRQVWTPPLRSAAFIVDPVGDPDRPDAFRIRGAGYGHGVGMCQVGAMARALEGQTYEEILAHYYREAKVVQAYK